MRVVVVAWLVFLTSACLRSLPDIPSNPNGGTIAGRIVELDPASGQQVAVPGVRVVTPLGGSARSDELGRFELTGLPLGAHRVLVVRPPRADGEDPTTVRILSGVAVRVDGERVELGDLEIREPGTLRGAVRVQGVPGGAVTEGTLVVMAETAFRGVVGADGDYTIARVAEGAVFDVVAFRAGYLPARARGVTVLPDTTVELSPLLLVPGEVGGMRSHVGSARLSSEAGGPAGIAVACHSDSSTAAAAMVTATTDDAGRYTLELGYGVHRCTASRAGYLPVTRVGVIALPDAVIGLGPVILSAEGAGLGLPGDRDGDGCADTVDVAPDDAAACQDFDGDAVADLYDLDDDGDGVSDAEEASPGRDGVLTDGRSADTDGDGVPDGADVCPAVADPDQTGEACREATVEEPLPTALVIDGFTPARAGAGLPVTIVGRGFAARAQSNVVAFAGEVLAAASAVTRDRLTVIVPVGARSGPLRVDNGLTAVTSTGSFEVVPAPIVTDFSPRRVAVGGAVVVRGRGLAQARVFVGGVEAAVSTSTHAEARLVVPPLAQGPQALEVRGEGGTTRPTLPLTVLGPVRVTDLVPATAGRGQLLRIRGGGLAVGPGERVEVAFAGAAARVAASSVADDEVRVFVPDDAVTGAVTVHHPTAVVMSPGPLTVDDGLVVVRALRPTIAMAGETVRLDGSNLDRVTMAYVGGVAATIGARTQTSLDVVVPAGAAAGAVTVESVDGGGVTRTSTAPQGLSLLREGRQIRGPSGLQLAFDPTRDVVYIGYGTTLRIMDLSTGVVTATVSTGLTNGFGRIDVHPAGTMLLSTQTTRVVATSLLDYRQSTCDAGTALSGEVHFTADGTHAAIQGYYRIVIVDLTTPTITCRTLTSVGSRVVGFVPTDDRLQLLASTDSRFDLLDFEPNSPGFGAVLAFWPHPLASLSQVLIWPPRRDVTSGHIPGSRLWVGNAWFRLVDPTDAGVSSEEVTAEGYVLRPIDQRRFAMGGDGDMTFVDLELRTSRTMTWPRGVSSIAIDPVRPRFAISTYSPAGAVIYDLEAAPLE